MTKFAVLGSGTWGCALARLLSRRGHETWLWSYTQEEYETLKTSHRYPNLPGVVMPEEIHYTTSLEEACSQGESVLFVVPSPAIRSTAHKIRPYIRPDQTFICASKGIEKETGMVLTDVIVDELGQEEKMDEVKICALSGPTHAEEVGLDIPTTIVAASEDHETAEQVQNDMMSPVMRIYTNTDIKGVELCGALKNIIALAAGISDGLGYGDNTKAALITRGLTEMTRLGVAMGSLAETFGGLAGLGDLVVTATSSHSRNMTCGRLIGKGLSTEEAVKKVGQVVEGINAILPALSLASQYDLEMPITEAVHAIIYEGKEPKEAVNELMVRAKKPEIPAYLLDQIDYD